MLVNFTDQGLTGVKPNRQDKSRETAKQFGAERKTNAPNRVSLHFYRATRNQEIQD
jgi:hypothetical protein